MASEMASGLAFEMVSGMVTEWPSELEMALEKPSESQLIGHVYFDVIYVV
jgi:hypothetical protein